jgi:LysM repeat protein
MFYPRAVTVTSERRRSEPVDSRRPRDAAVLLPPAAFATRRICPYLVVDGESWRSASPSRDHRCGAVAPPAPLAADKQRRLCLSDRHAGCATFLAAQSRPLTLGLSESAETVAARLAPGRTTNKPGGETVTRWSLARTAPVVLDHGRIPALLGALSGRSRASQFVLGVLLLAAFGAIGLARLGGGGGPLTAAGPSPSVSASSRVAGGLASAAPAAPSGGVEGATATAAPSSPSAGASPPAAANGTYRVKRGDTLYVIARRLGTTVKILQQLNGLGSSTTIHAGDILKTP